VAKRRAGEPFRRGDHGRNDASKMVLTMWFFPEKTSAQKIYSNQVFFAEWKKEAFGRAFERFSTRLACEST
jgi:hypothetical protein